MSKNTSITIPHSAKGKYSKYFAEKVLATLKYPTGKNSSPYGLLVFRESKRVDNNQFIVPSWDKTSQMILEQIPAEQETFTTLFDLSAFRPDIRDYINFTEKDVEIIVLYEKVKYTNVISMIPRYILHEDNMFVNIR
jgi:hypothetical protein